MFNIETRSRCGITEMRITATSSESDQREGNFLSTLEWDSLLQESLKLSRIRRRRTDA